MSTYATGGIVPGYKGEAVTVKEAGKCPNGHPLYLIGGDWLSRVSGEAVPEHIIPNAEIRAGGGEIARCAGVLR